MPRLLSDIKSYCSSRIYGIAGTEVSIIADHGHVQIVEDKTGFRFPVLTGELTEGSVVVNPKQPEVTEKPRTSRSHRKKAVPITQQQNLF